MDSLIRETNENLKAIINNMKSNLDNSISTLDNLQMQMDKKVEEAKKFKIQVDSAKDTINELEESNKSLELSLKELNDKYGKMNLVSLVEAGNREIKAKINDNNREINKQKEHIADLTNKARTIKDLLIDLKKDKTIKENRLENIKTAYEYYNERINDVMDYAFNHAENLNDYKKNYNDLEEYESYNEEVKDIELENTMVFDEIANIDENKNFKDEMSFINDQIDDAINNSNKIHEMIKKNIEDYNSENSEINENNEEIEEVIINENDLDTTQVFDTIFQTDSDKKDQNDIEEEIDKTTESVITEPENDNNEDIINILSNEIIEETTKETDTTFDIASNSNLTDISESNSIENIEPLEENNKYDNDLIDTNPEILKEEKQEIENKINNLDLFNLENIKNEELDNDIIKENDIDDSEDRINKINELFNSLDNTTNTNLLEKTEPFQVNGIDSQIDNAYMDLFGKPLEEESLNKKETTLTDIFGNPIKNEDLSEEVKIGKKIEELFVENGIDFNKFKEDEQNYLKQIYDEEKFNNILNTLKRNKINLDNLYNSFNIFGEITANELENLISKLVNSGQSVEAIGLILEKLPKVKKYNLNDAIISYGDYIKDIDITELIMKAKELYNGGNN